MCRRLKELEEEIEDNREVVMGHIKDINSIKKVVDTEILILIITGPCLLIKLSFLTVIESMNYEQRTQFPRHFFPSSFTGSSLI